jgi:hypothetical protein
MEMHKDKHKCFVIMPFIPELHYFYLYIQKHIEQNHNIKCERADAQVLTKPLLDKIVDFIQNSDVIIADCSGRNPNVFYELGLAHAFDKKVILITKDQMQEVPSDIRHYEFIRYDLDKHTDFLEKLDNALRNVFAERYENLYQKARTIFSDFRNSTGAGVTIASKEDFLTRVMQAELREDLPSLDDDLQVAEFALPKIIADANNSATMKQITRWLSEKQKTS